MIGRLLALLVRHGPLVLALGIALSVLVPALATFLGPALGPFIALLMLVALLRLDPGELVALARRPLVPGLALVILLLGAPMIVWLVVGLLDLPAPLAQAMVLNGAAPVLMSSAALAQMIGLNAALSIGMIVGSTLLLPLTLPLVMIGVLDLGIDLDHGAFAGRFFLYIVVPFVAAWLLRRHFGADAFIERRSTLDGLGVIFVVLAGIALMDGVTARLLATPATVALYLGAATVFNGLFQVLGALLFSPLGRHRALGLALCLGNRNMGLVLVLTGGLLGAEFALYVAMAQIPMYLMPAIVKPIYGRYL
ncbi:MAG: hypothetical protein AAF495_08435 [Pseudomonadota bacterium]